MPLKTQAPFLVALNHYSQHNTISRQNTSLKKKQRFVVIDVKWLITLIRGGGRQNRPRLLGN